MQENTNKIEITDGNDTHLAFLENISDCSLSEQINAGYMFTFTAYVDDLTQYIAYGNLVIVEGQKFEIARITKKRGDYPNILVECDHVSYRLNRDDVEIEFDDTPTNILAQLLQSSTVGGNSFSVGTVDFPYPVYFKPGEKSIRETIIELAGFLGGEIIWDNFSVSIVSSRGSNNGLHFKVGENVKEFSHEVDYTAEEPFTSIELDVVDLARLEGFEEFYNELHKINLGDTARLSDPLLGIDETQRIVSYERDPFKKELPKINIGNVPRLFTDYGEREKTDEEIEASTVYFRGEGILYVGVIGDENEFDPVVYSFKVGSQEILEVEDSDFTDEYLFGFELFHPDIFVELKTVRTIARVSEHTLRAYNVVVKNDVDVYTNVNFKGDTLTIIGKYPNDVELYIYDGEMIPENIIKAYGASVIVEKNGDGDDEYREWMSKLTIAGENVLAEPGLNKTHEAIEGQIKSPPIVYVSSEWGNLVLEVPPDKMRDYYIRVSAMNLINGRSIRTYNKNGFSGNQFTGSGWGPFAVDRETARYVIQFRTDNEKDGSGIVRAFAFNATLTLPEDLDEWPDSGGGKDSYYIEFGRVKLSDEMYFEFKNKEGYDGYAYVSHAIMSGQVTPSGLTVSFNEVYSENKIVGVEAYSNHSSVDPNFFGFVTMQAVCGGETSTPPV